MYAKIFQQMYDGTLATNGPWEALITFQQLLILADIDGVVDLTPQAISRRTTIPLHILEKGLAVLMLPDPDSRTPDADGRRIQLVASHRNWGWRITNYGKYRAIKREEDRRDYHREYYHAKRKNQASSTGSTQTQQASTIQPIEEEEEEAVKHLLVLKKKRAVTVVPEGFETFWKAYPRKVAKPAALKAYSKLSPDISLQATILDAISDQSRSQGWTKDGGTFIPHPASWLNGERWADTAPSAASSSPTAWSRTDSGISAMAAQLGQKLRDDDTHESWHRRVLTAWQRAGEPAPHTERTLA